MTKAALLVIGNEILSGRTQDVHISFLAQRLENRGIELKEVRVVPDEEKSIVKGIKELRSFDLLFTTGGIGITHDDITKSCIAKAMNLPLEDFKHTVSVSYSNPGFFLLPRGSKPIIHPSGLMSFSLENIYVLPGVPKFMRMLFDVIEPSLPLLDSFLTLTQTYHVSEDDIASILEKLQKKYPDISLGSYPFYEPQKGVDLVLRGKNKKKMTRMASELEESINLFFVKAFCSP